MKTGYTKSFSGTTLAQYLLSNPDAFRVDLFTIALASGATLLTTTFQTDLLLGGDTFYASKYGMWSRGSITASTDCTQDSEIQVTVSAPLGTVYPFSNTPLLQTVASSIFDKARVTIQTAWLPKPFNTNNVTPAPIDSNYVATKFVGDIVTSADPLTTTQAVFKVAPLPYMLQEPWPQAQVQPGCRYALFDKNCTLNKAAFAQTRAVAAGSTQLIINLSTALPNASPYYEQGFITFTTGQNQGLSGTIAKQLSTTQLQLTRRITASEDPALIGQAGAILVIEAVCCQEQPDEITSRRSLVEDITGYSTDEIQAEIADHVSWLASHHANVHKAKDFVDGLISSS